MKSVHRPSAEGGWCAGNVLEPSPNIECGLPARWVEAGKPLELECIDSAVMVPGGKPGFHMPRTMTVYAMTRLLAQVNNLAA